MLKWLKDYWAYIRFLFSGDNDYLYNSASGCLVAKGEMGLSSDLNRARISAINNWAKEKGEVSILSISVWSEGERCDHAYRKVPTSISHGAQVKAHGTHKDYVCRKCGHSFCTVIAPEASEHGAVWAAVLREKQK